MPVVCSICGGTHVSCAAVVNPNTKGFIEFGHEAFIDAQCEQCGFVALTDPDEAKADIDARLRDYYQHNTGEPRYALCEYVDTENYEGSQQCLVQLFPGEIPEGRPGIIASCNGIDALKAFTVPDPKMERGFTIVECLSFTAKPL